MFFIKRKPLLIISILTIFFSCGGKKIPIADEKSALPERKAYIVLRSEGDATTIEGVKGIIASDFLDNNVATNFSVYRARQGWDQNRIFETAYTGQYDYIVLIDQVAKFTIDNSTQVGGKYQLRSYHIKSPNPDWLDLGQATCNITVKPSIQKFSREIIRSIVGNAAVFKNHDFDYDEAVVTNTSENKVESTSSPKDLTNEVERLKLALKTEKERTKLAQAEKKRMENQLKLKLETEKQKAQLAQLEAKNASDRRKQRQKDIAKSYAAKREEIRKREAEEALRNPVVEPGPKEPTRRDRIRERQETKKRLAQQREERRKQEEEAAFKRQENRRRLAEEKRQAQKKQKEAFEAKRKETERLAGLKRQQKKQQAEQEKANALAAELAESKRLDAKRQAEALELQRQEAERLATQQHQEEQLRIEREKADALATQEREAKRIAKTKKLEDKRKASRLAEEKRLEEKRQAQLKAEEARKASQRAEAKRQADALERQRQETERLATLQRQEAERLAEQQRLDKELALQKQEAERLAQVENAKQRELKKQRESRKTKKANKKRKSKNKSKPTSAATASLPSGPKHAFVVIKGKETDASQFEDLKDNIEFNFMFAKVKSKIEIFKEDESTALSHILPRSSDADHYVILIDQSEYIGDGKSVYSVKVYKKASSSDWQDVISEAFNLSSKDGLKQLSKEITDSISN